MNASRMLGITTGSQAKATEKLSSGYRINRAADDAAGLSISEKMRKQIRGLSQASTNAQDGVSCVQTAEGALNEVHSMLQRMNELAVQSANGTNSTVDRDAIQAEIDQLSVEIDRVSTTTKFNETYLLQGGGTATREVTKDVPAVEAVPVQANYVSGKGTDTIALQSGKTVAADAKWYEKDGTTALTETELLEKLEIDAGGNVVLKEGVELFKVAADETNPYGAQLDAQKVGNGDVQGVFEVATFKVSTANDGSALVEAEDTATAAIDTIAAAIQKVSEQRSALGAVQNRLEHTIANLDNVVENTTSAESRIRDVDMAEEMVEYSKNNILAQAGQSMLAQANQANQGVLSLLQ